MATGENADLSPRMRVTLALIGGFLPVMSAVIGGLWILKVYLDDQQKAAQARADAIVAQTTEQRKVELALAEERTKAETARAQAAADQAKAATDQAKLRMIELRKPLLDRQFALYTELSQLSGKLSVLAAHVQPAYSETFDRFRALAATELRVVGDAELLTAVAAFEDAAMVHLLQGGTPTQKTMADRARDLGLAFRKSMERTWASVASQ